MDENVNKPTSCGTTDTQETLSADDLEILESFSSSATFSAWRSLVINDPSKMEALLNDIMSRSPEMAAWIGQHQDAFLSLFYEVVDDSMAPEEDPAPAVDDGPMSSPSMEEEKSSEVVCTRVLSLEGIMTQSDGPNLCCRTLAQQLAVPMNDNVNLEGPTYEAISYAWGDPNDRQQISCDGQTVEISTSLHEVLRKLWTLQPDLVLWADALSIDQKNLKEKEYQVSKMGLIFSSAQKVHVWVGEKSSYIEAFWPWLQLFEHDDWFARLLASAFDYVDMRERTDPIMGAKGEWDFRDDACLLGMKDLLTRKWFTSAWTYQEVIAARTWILHCGNRQADGPALERLLDACENTMLAQLEAVPATRKGAIAFCLQLQRICENGQKENRGQYLARSPGRHLLSDLANIHHRHASDPCDKVNAVLGLHPEAWIKPSYQKTPEWVYAHAARVCIEESQSFALWNYSRPTLGSEYLGALPSWAIDWRRPSIGKVTGPKHYDLFAAHPCQLADEDYSWGESQYLGMLTVRGIVCGVIWEDPNEAPDARYWLEEIPSSNLPSDSMDTECGKTQDPPSHKILGPLLRHINTTQACPGKKHHLQILFPNRDKKEPGKTHGLHLAKPGDYLCILYGAHSLVILRPEKNWRKIQNHTLDKNWEQLAQATQDVQPFKLVSLVRLWRSYWYVTPNWGNAPLSVPKLQVGNGNQRLSIEKVRSIGDPVAESELDQLVELLTRLNVVPATFVII